MAQTDKSFQQLAMERAGREEARIQRIFGEDFEFEIPVVCWKDEPEQCTNFPEFQIYQLDGTYYYTCRDDMEELIDGLPPIPFGSVTNTERKN